MPTWIVRWTDAVRPYRAADVGIIDADELQTTDSWLVWWGLRWVIGQPRLIVVLRLLRSDVASVRGLGEEKVRDGR